MSVVSKTSQYFSGFSPPAIPGCVLWLDATDSNTFTLSAGNVTAWRDKSGNGANGTANTPIVYNANGLGTGYPALTFTGTQWVSGAVSVTVNTMTIFNVFSMNSTSPFAARVLSLAATETNDFNNNSYVGILRQSSTNMGPYRNGTYTQAVTPYSTRLMNTTYFDGTNQYTATNAGTVTSNASSGAFAISAYRVANSTSSTDPNGPLNGFVGEVIVYDRMLTTAQRQAVEGYLAFRWGLTLPSTHPFKSPAVPFMRPFIPVDISGCSLWLDAADSATLTLSGTNVTVWGDKSGNARNATQTTVSLQPTYNRDRSAIVFPDLKYLDMTDAFNMLSSVGKFYSVFVVERRASSKNQNFMLGFGGSTFGAGLAFGYNSNTVFRHTYAAVADTDYTVAGYQVTDPIRIWSGGYNGALRDLNLNGLTVTTTNPYTTPMTAWTQPCIGFLPLIGLNQYFVGDIYEIIFYNSYLTTRERQQVETYLANKWGLRGSTPAGHFARLCPAVTTQFSPLVFAGCQLWLDGKDPNGNGTTPANAATVSTWVDKSGNTRNATTSTSANPPTYNLSEGCLQFRSASSQSLNIAQAFGNALVGVKFSVFIVGRRLASVYAGLLTGEAIATNGNLLIGFQGTTFTGGYYNGPTASATIPAYSSPDPVYVLGFDSLTSQMQVVVNGTIGGTVAAATNLVSFTGPSIGRRYGGTGAQTYHDVDVFEMISFVPPLTTPQRQLVEGYLAAKWRRSTSLPNTHPYKTLTP
jgi:hypothetical protein